MAKETIKNIIRQILSENIDEIFGNPDVSNQEGVVYFEGMPFSVVFKHEKGVNKIRFAPLNITTLNQVNALGKTIVANKIRNAIVKMGVKNPVYNADDDPSKITFTTDSTNFDFLKPGGQPHDMKYDFSLNEKYA